MLQVQVHNTEPCHGKLIHIIILTQRNLNRLINTCYILDMITYIIDALSSLIFTTIS